MVLSSPSARDGTASHARDAFYADYSFMRFSSSPFKAERRDDMMHGGVCFDREGSLGSASRASPPRAGASPRRAGGTRAVDRGVVRSGAQVLLRDRDTRPLVASARHGETVHRTVRGERQFIMSFAAPPPSSSAPKAHAHPPVSPATERDMVAEASADARGVLKVRPHLPTPPLAHAAPRHRRKRKEREAERSTHGLEPSV